MKLSKRTLHTLCFLIAAGFVLGASVQWPRQAAGQGQKKIESTDPALRQKWYEQHMSMKGQTPFKDLRWRYVGPTDISGRCTAIAVPKGNKKTIYIGSASGGLWKTTNTGVTWEPLFDEMATLSIGALAIPDTAPETIWVGTGEANILRGSLAGNGIYKSTDGGMTFRNMGLAGTNTIARIRIHPTNPDIVYVAASGHEWTYNQDRGVYKTTDGGRTWDRVFYINDQTGAIDLIMDPRNPNTLVASMWNRIRQRWSDPVPGGEGLFKTTDGGKNWKKLTSGLPTEWKVIGRIGLDFCLTKPDIVYAFVDNHTPVGMPKPGERDSYGRIRTYPDIMGAEVYRSENFGETWQKVEPADAQQKTRMQRFGGTYGWVFSQIRVDPINENIVFLLGVSLVRSTDGGKSFQTVSYNGLHSDHHGMWIDPSDTNYIVEVNDGGANASYDGGMTWREFHAPIQTLQFYNITLDMATPFNAYGSVQDQGTFRAVGLGPLPAGQPQGRGRGRGPTVRWEGAQGGEGTLIEVDPTNPNIMYSCDYYGRVTRNEYVNGRWVPKVIYPDPANKNIVPMPDATEPVYRGQWLAATILSPHNPSTLYHGFQFVFKTTDKGETWKKISADLTAFDPAKQGKLPYAIPFATITALSESPLKAGVLYAGTDDGRVHVTRDDGATWTEITAGLPYFKHVWGIVASKYEPATVYITLIGRHDDDFNPYVYKSTDYGKTWTSIAANLPGGPTNVIREDPKKANVLYLGTDLGVFVTLDGAKSWSYLGTGLPNAAVWDIQVHPRDNMMVIATDGRGVWVLDNVAPVQNAK